MDDGLLPRPPSNNSSSPPSSLSSLSTLSDSLQPMEHPANEPLPSSPSFTDDISAATDPDVEMSDLDDLTAIPDAFNLPNLLRFRTDLLPPLPTPTPAPNTMRPPPGDGPTTIMHLPNEVLDNILRHLCTRPSARQPLWETLSDSRNAMSFALTCTRVLALFRARLVSIRTKPERYREDLLYTPPVAGAVVDARSVADVFHLGAVLRLAGPALQELLITKSLPSTSWVDSYVACVTGLRKLSLRDVNADYPLGAVLASSSRTLKELEIVGATGMALSQPQLNSLATHASSVHTLALRLSMFDHDWTPVWMGLGPGLHKLSLGATRFWIMDTEENILLEQIGRYCCDLRHLHFYHLGPTLGNACARLCARYGEQLETLELEQSQMLRPDLTLLAASCPTTTVSISHGSSLFSHSYNVDIIDLLGPQISTLKYRSQLAHDESLWEVGRKCTNLRELRLDCASTLTESAVESILKPLGPGLTSLSMGFFVRGLERALASTALIMLAQYAESLEELHIGGQKFDMEAFREVARRCRSTLQRVSVTFGFRTAGEREIIDTPTLVDVITALHPCELLTSVVILDRTTPDNRANCVELRQASYPLRKRCQRISVCGIDYVR